jgi:hypothetical protein
MLLQLDISEGPARLDSTDLPDGPGLPATPSFATLSISPIIYIMLSSPDFCPYFISCAFAHYHRFS